MKVIGMGAALIVWGFVSIILSSVLSGTIEIDNIVILILLYVGLTAIIANAIIEKRTE